eukprot:1143981-Pelagomonas_calceolata.AAC.4
MQDSPMLLDLTGARLHPVLDTQVAVAVLQLDGLKVNKGLAALMTAGGGWPNKLGLGKMMEVGTTRCWIMHLCQWPAGTSSSGEIFVTDLSTCLVDRCDVLKHHVYHLFTCQ